MGCFGDRSSGQGNPYGRCEVHSDRSQLPIARRALHSGHDLLAKVAYAKAAELLNNDLYRIVMLTRTLEV